MTESVIFVFHFQYLAMFDLCHLSQFSSTRRKQIFSLSQPSEFKLHLTEIKVVQFRVMLNTLAHK